MSAGSTRKIVFVILSALTVVMLFASRNRLMFPIAIQKEVGEHFYASSSEPKPVTAATMNATRTPQVTKGQRNLQTYNLITAKPTTTKSEEPDEVNSDGTQYKNPGLDTLVEMYQQKIETVRRQLLQSNITVNNKPSKWVLLDGYDKDIFQKIQKYKTIIPVYLTNSMEMTKAVLPAKNYYNYIASNSTCKKMDKNNYYGPTLLNKTCVRSIKEVHRPVPLDRVQLSVGIPFKMTENGDLPVGSRKRDVLLHFGFIVKDALILSHGIVFSNGSALQPQRCKPSIRTKVPSKQSSLPVYSEVFSLTQQTGTGFYHLTLEDLPRIAPYLSFLLKYKHIKIHCKNKNFSNNMLKYLGITKDRLIFGDVKVEIVYMPAGTACGRPGVFTTQLLSTLFHRKMPKEILDRKQDTIVLIKRSSKSRQFSQHQEILKMLETVAKNRGLRAVEYRDDPTPSLNKTLEVFYRALLVVAPHGAGLSNLAFSRPGVVILESYCLVNLCFRNLMANIGHIHHGYMNGDFNCLHASPENFRKDIEKHLDILGLAVN